MKRNCIYFILINLLFFVSSCSESLDELHEDKGQEQVEIINTDLIDKNTIDISVDDAQKISALFTNSQPELRSSTAKSISEIKAVYDEGGKPTMYIVNYSNNGGFILISATKNYLPILAFSDNGNFDTSNLQDGAELFYNNYNGTLAQINNEVIDSLRIKFAADWAVFEQEDEPSPALRSLSNDVYQKRQEEIARWQAQGYECFELNAAYSFLPADKAYHFINDICSHYHPSYNCMSTAIFLIKRIYENTGKLTRTTWNQTQPFNINAPNGWAGCVPIAMAQIMRYHQWPTSYTWSQIPEGYGSATNETHRFIQDVRNRANVKYKSNGTSASYDDAKDAFKKFNYSVGTYDFYGYSDRQRIADEIKGKRPVYMRGERSNGEGHAWMCEGYKADKIQYSAAMISGEIFNPNTIEYMHYTGTTEIIRQYYYMNWGWGGSSNAWFFLGNIGQDIQYAYGEIHGINDHNFKKDIKYITVKPNK